MIKLYIKGGFYYCYNDDSIIISYLCNYKIINNRVGFPINSINKVVNILIDNKIDYIIYNKNNIIDKYINKENRYNNILIKAKSNIDINNRINNIVSSLSRISLLTYSYFLSKYDKYNSNLVFLYNNDNAQAISFV